MSRKKEKNKKKLDMERKDRKEVTGPGRPRGNFLLIWGNIFIFQG